MQAPKKDSTRNFVSRVKLQNFSKVLGSGNGCLQSVDSLVRITILIEGWKAWIKNDEFFMSYSLRIASIEKENDVSSYWKRTGVIEIYCG